MRSKRSQERMIATRQALQQVEVQEGAEFLERVRGDLQLRGVNEEVSDEIARRLCEQHSDAPLSIEHYEAMLDGASLACGVDREANDGGKVEDLGKDFGEDEVGNRDSVVRVREIERMMQNFAGELSKLDESLEVMATYVRRMRNRSAPKLVTRKNETLH